MHTPFEIGDIVQVLGGPLDGLRGILIKVDGENAVLDLGEAFGATLVLPVERVATAD